MGRALVCRLVCWQLGVDARTAREKLRVAHALATLPLVAAQMRAGRLPYSKVRAITRIAEPANEQGLVDIALAGTTSQVERIVAAYRRALPPGHEASDATQWMKRGLHVSTHPDRTVTITVTLPAPLAMEVIAAVDAYAPRPGPTEDGERPTLATRRADGLVALAGSATTASPGGADDVNGRDDATSRTGRPGYLVHLHVGPEQQEAHPEGRAHDVVVGVSDATAERMCCDADLEAVAHGSDGSVAHVSARGSVVRGRLRRFIEQRDRTCRVPGCTHRARHHIHHLHHRAHGGSNDPENLVLVCAYHHHRLHEGGWSARRLADGTLEFVLPNGRVLPAGAPVFTGDAVTVAAHGRDADDGRCHWVGDRLDLDWTLMTLFSQTPWHDPWLSAWLERHHPDALLGAPAPAAPTVPSAPRGGSREPHRPGGDGGP